MREAIIILFLQVYRGFAARITQCCDISSVSIYTVTVPSSLALYVYIHL